MSYSAALSCFSRPDGSAIYSCRNSVVQCSVFGPGEVNLSKVDAEKAFLEVIYKKRVRPSNRDCPEVKFIEEFIKTNVEAVLHVHAHPRSSIVIIMQELQDDGSLLSCCLNAVCCALIDCGLPMKHLISSQTVMIDDKEQVIVNPTNEDMQNASASFVMTFESKSNQITSVTSKGTFSFNQFQKCLKKCRSASEEVFQMYRETLIKKHTKS